MIPAISHEPISDQQLVPTLVLVPHTPMQSSGATVGIDGDLEPGQLRSLPSCIPAPPPPGSGEALLPRTLVLCFDGTGDQFDTDVSITIPN